jgi:hypothetical protein
MQKNAFTLASSRMNKQLDIKRDDFHTSVVNPLTPNDL